MKSLDHSLALELLDDAHLVVDEWSKLVWLSDGTSCNSDHVRLLLVVPVRVASPELAVAVRLGLVAACRSEHPQVAGGLDRGVEKLRLSDPPPLRARPARRSVRRLRESRLRCRLASMFSGDPCELDARVDLELLKDMTHVCAHRVRGEEQMGGGLTVGHSAGYRLDDGELGSG